MKNFSIFVKIDPRYCVHFSAIKLCFCTFQCFRRCSWYWLYMEGYCLTTAFWMGDSSLSCSHEATYIATQSVLNGWCSSECRHRLYFELQNLLASRWTSSIRHTLVFSIYGLCSHVVIRGGVNLLQIKYFGPQAIDLHQVANSPLELLP